MVDAQRVPVSMIHRLRPERMQVVLTALVMTMVIMVSGVAPASARDEPTVFRDAQGRLLGSEEVRNDGALEARGRFGKLLGVFDPNNNQTRDASGRLVGTGNLLAALIFDPRENR